MAEPDGRFKLYTVDTSQTLTHRGQTSIIEVRETRDFAFIAQWSADGKFGAAINGALIASMEDHVEVQDKIILPARKQRPRMPLPLVPAQW
jgi:hypothetical protein